MLTSEHIKYKDSTSYTSLLDILYPVGSIFITIGTTNPANHLGGSWIEVSDGVIAAKGYGTVGSVAGSKTISTTQMPSHTHAISGSLGSAGSHNHQSGNDTASRPVSFACFYNESTTNLTLISGKVTNSSSGTFQALGWNNQTFPKGHAYGNHSTNAAGSHTHTLNASAASTGGGSNYLPYSYVTHVWRRVS